MKPSTEDGIEGARGKLKAKVKTGFGKLTGNRDLEQEGKNDRLKGPARKMVGEIKKGLASLTNSLLLPLGALVWVGLSVGFSCRKSR